MPFPDGSYLTQWRDLDRTCEEFAKFSKNDGVAYRRMITEYETVRPILNDVAFTALGFGTPINDRLADPPHGKLWQRRLAMSAWEIIRDTFQDDHCRAFMLGCPYPLQPVQDPMTGRAAYIPLHQQRESRPLPKGGTGALTVALARFNEAHGGMILTNKWIKALIVENGKCTGVECEDGSSYRAEKAVVSTIHIKQLVDMAPRELWGQDFLDGVDTWEAGLTLFETNYATTEPPQYAVAGGTLSPARSGAHEPAQLARQLSRRWIRTVAIRRDAARAGLGAASHADPGLVSDGRDNPSRRVRHGRPGTKRGNRDAERFRNEHRGSRQEKGVRACTGEASA